MDLQEVGYEGIDSNNVAYGRDRWQALSNKVLNLQVP
jgi:hypothetical protein